MRAFKYIISIAGGSAVSVIGLGVLGATMMPETQPKRDAVAMFAGSFATAMLLWNFDA